MSTLLGLAASVGASPGGSDTGSGAPDPASVGPGVIGFIVVFALIVAAIFLFRSMTGHLRRVDYRSRHRQPARREEAADDERAQESSLEDPGNGQEEEGRTP